MLCKDEIRLYESVHCNGCECKAENGYDNDTDNLYTLEPGLSVPAYSLEHTPESVGKVEPQGCEPYKVEHEVDPAAEGCGKQKVRIPLFPAEEHLELHLCPEMQEVVENEAQDDDSQNHHIAGRPGIGCTLVGNGIAVDSSAGPDITVGKPQAIEYMDKETCRQNGNHYGYDRKCHKVTSLLEEAVGSAEPAGESVDYRKRIDCYVKTEEHNEKCTADGLYELLSD